MRVRILPTGHAELEGLVPSLRALFPDHDIDVVPRRVEPTGAAVPWNGFTTARLRPGQRHDRLDELVDALAAEVHPGRDGEPADIAIVVDDLELENVDQPAVVVGAVQAAVRAHIARYETARGSRAAERLRDALRRRASIHFAVPMIEAWFFADAAALERAGVPAGRLPPQIRTGIDPESFETADLAYLTDDGSGCTALAARNARGGHRREKRAFWVKSPSPVAPDARRERHPKAYLTWLCRAPELPDCTTYDEKAAGAALGGLQWPIVLAEPAWCSFARAFIDDLGDVLGSPARPVAAGRLHPLLERKHGGGDWLLRNV